MGQARAGLPGRRRRTTAEVRAAIAEAALTLFAERGYGGTSTRDITARAGVAEPLLFRHFGSKSNLFEQAVIEPFSRFVKDYIAEIGQQSESAQEPNEAAVAYLSRLYDFCVENRQVAQAIFSAARHEDVASELQLAVLDLNDLFRRLEEIVRFQSTFHRGKPAKRPNLVVRLTFGMVMAVTVLDDWLFPPGVARPGRAEMILALVDYVVYGVSAGSGPEDHSLPLPEFQGDHQVLRNRDPGSVRRYRR
jgi:AcrR family transcriptional regulator